MSLKSKVGRSKFAQTIPAAAQRFEALLGVPVALEIDLDSFDVDPYGNGPFFEWDLAEIQSGFEAACYGPMLKVMTDMSAEPIMKEFLVESLKTIKVTRSDPNQASWGQASFDAASGVFTIGAGVMVNLGPYQREVHEMIEHAFNEAG